MEKFILIDGNAIFHRAYHSLPPFKTSRGETTNAIYGFLAMLISLYKKEKPDYLAVAWDRKAPTYRHNEYKEYKAHRPPPPEDLYPQLPRLKEILDAFQITQMEMDGYEADDLLGTAARQAEREKNLQIIIVTGDKDALQLVSDHTSVMTPIKGITEVELYDTVKVEQKLGVRPNQIIDYKALCGDASDNIPGVPGIGPKQAARLLKQYDNFENIYNHLNELPAGQRKKLEAGGESGLLSKKLVSLQMEAPIEFYLDKYRSRHIFYDKIKKLFDELEFKTLGKKLDELRELLEPGQKMEPSAPFLKQTQQTKQVKQTPHQPMQRSLF